MNGKNDQKNEQSKELTKEWRYARDHLKELIIGDITKGVVTRSTLKHISNYAFTFKIVSKNVNDALEDEYWI